MEWHVWNEQEGELSARERLMAILAFKIGANVSLTGKESVAQLYQLPDADVFAVLNMVALFNYWQQLTAAYEHVQPGTDEQVTETTEFDALPPR